MAGAKRLTFMATFIKAVKLLDRILEVGYPTWKPYLSAAEDAAVLAIMAGIKALVGLLPVPD